MKYLYLLLLVTILSCSKEENCGCHDFIGKKMYINIGNSVIDDCNYVDDIYYNKNGTIDLYRSGGGYDNEKMEAVINYEIDENCLLHIKAINYSKVLPEKCDPIFSYTALNLGEGTKVPMTIITCESYNIGAITHLDYNPR